MQKFNMTFKTDFNVIQIFLLENYILLGNSLSNEESLEHEILYEHCKHDFFSFMGWLKNTESDTYYSEEE